MSGPKLLVTKRGSVTRVTLNRPDLGNVSDLEMADALRSASIRCVVLTGAGRMFCAGGDVAMFQAAGDPSPVALSELAGTLHFSVSRLGG